MARPDAPQGNFATSTFRPCFCASVSVRPHQAISGSVKTTAGIACGSNATLSPAIASTATRPSCDALCASIGSPTTSPMAKMFGSAVRVASSTSMKPRSSTFTSVLSRPGTASSACGRPTRARGRTSAPSPRPVLAFERDRDAVLLLLHRDDLGLEQDLRRSSRAASRGCRRDRGRRPAAARRSSRRR